MPVKSIEELKTLRDKYSRGVLNREANDPESTIRVTVGMATCGIASGARETINAMIDEIEALGIRNVKVVQSGCMGYCYAEPTVEVSFPEREPVLYGRVDGERAREIVRRHIKNGERIKDWEIVRGFDRA